MKKVLSAIFIIIILAMIPVGILKYDNYKNPTVYQTEEIVQEEIDEKEGMRITMLGGSNMKDKGDTNSMGFFIRTNKDTLIAVDGGNPSDAPLLKKYIDNYGNGKVDYWFITHAHEDHCGGLIELLKSYDIEIENLVYSFNSREWYEINDSRGKDSEIAMLDSLSNPKIKNKIECFEDQKIEIDNIECDIIRVANPEIVNSDNGNEASMVFKLTAKDVDKSMIFLGDAYIKTSEELAEKKERLSSYAVQMAHHGQNGVTEEIYDFIKPTICFFNCPEWLYNNDGGNGFNTGKWKTIEVLEWMKKYNTTNYVAYNGDVQVQLYSLRK